jgi:copper chaperone CopZ
VAQRFLIKIDGMHAIHAVRAVETALGGLAGVRALEVSLGEASVTHDGQLTPTRLREAIRDAGFEVASVLEDRRHRLPLLE